MTEIPEERASPPAGDRPPLLATDTALKEAAAVAMLGFIALLGISLWLQNSTFITTNGLWKSFAVAHWADWSPERTAFKANILYYPLTGLLARLIPESIGGPVWRRMALINTFWAGLILGTVYLFARRALSCSREVALQTALFHMGGAFFLALGLTNEDIMGGYFLIFATLSLATAVCANPSAKGVASVSAIFTLAWLFEWRLIAPTAPILVIALALHCKDWSQRAKLSAVAIGVSLLLVFLAALAFPTAQKTLQSMIDSVWPGKGLNTGYAGFSIAKCWLLLSGMGQSFLEGMNIGTLAVIFHRRNFTYLIVKLVILSLLLAALLWRGWRSEVTVWRTASLLFIGNFMFGEIVNLYSQPQDPQMQINVMCWMVPAWAALSTMNAESPSRPRHLGLWALALVPLLLNLSNFTRFRGDDTRNRHSAQSLESKFQLSKTVFIDNGFEGSITWRAAFWGWKAPPQKLGPAPQEQPRYKHLFLLSQATVYPKRSPQESAKAVMSRLRLLRTLGYRLIINRTWEFSEARFCDSFATVSGPAKPRAIHASLHGTYVGRKVHEDPHWGPYYELIERQP